jgi:hypothetical protein
MGDSPMVVVWPSRGAEGIYDFVTLSQRKAPYETMPTPDTNPPFAAKLDLSNTFVRLPRPSLSFLRVSLCSDFVRSVQITEEHFQIAFTRRVSGLLSFLFSVYSLGIFLGH